MDKIVLPLDIKVKKQGIITFEDEYLTLPSKSLILDNDKFGKTKEKIELFLDDEHNMKTKAFARKILLANEVQSNNMVEHYYDDIEAIKKEISSRKPRNKREEKELRILNLYKAYRYILDNKNINKDTLHELYGILSYNLLKDDDLRSMGPLYRNDGVEIDLTGAAGADTLKCMPYYLVEKHMDKLFDFINSDFNASCMTDEYIKSQIIHFYFVYIHPYFDINGRSSRTTAIWQLLNKKAYPFVMFNRGIHLNKNEYYKVLKDVRRFANISFFIDYMLKTVLVEMQKEHLMQTIRNEFKDLRPLDHQTMHYLLSMNGNLSLCDFANSYNMYNNKKSISYIYNEMILPLLEQNILLKLRDTNKMVGNDMHNFIIGFNPKYIDDDPVKSSELKIKKTAK